MRQSLRGAIHAFDLCILWNSASGFRSEPDDEEIARFIEMAAAEEEAEASRDKMAPSTQFAGTSMRGGPKGVLDDYRLAQADLARRVRTASLCLLGIS